MLTLLTLLACTAAPPPGPAESLGWLAGSWATHRANFRTEENWQALSDGTLLGHSSIRGGSFTVFSEAMVVIDLPEGRTLITWPVGREDERYTLVDATDQQAVFAREGEVFPQRITYVRTDASTLEVTATGVEDGAPKTDTWALTKDLPPLPKPTPIPLPVRPQGEPDAPDAE